MCSAQLVGQRAGGRRDLVLDRPRGTTAGPSGRAGASSRESPPRLQPGSAPASPRPCALISSRVSRAADGAFFRYSGITLPQIRAGRSCGATGPVDDRLHRGLADRDQVLEIAPRGDARHACPRRHGLSGLTSRRHRTGSARISSSRGLDTSRGSHRSAFGPSEQIRSMSRWPSCARCSIDHPTLE